MPQYAILRFAKHKGGAGALEAHHERKKDKYASNPDIDSERSKYNFHIVAPVTSYKRETDNRIVAAGCKTRKDSVRFVDTLITASSDFFKGKKRAEIRAYFKTAVDFLAQKIGKSNIFAAVVHLDERTPHLHLCFTPITEDGRLSAKDIIGNRTQLTHWQDSFFVHMVNAYPDIERGESASVTGRRHIPTRVFKQAVQLTKQAGRIAAALDGINPLNAGKKRDEVLELLQKFFPGMEDFEKQVRKYHREIKELESDNTSLKKEAAALEKQVEAGKKVSISKQLEDNRLLIELDNLRRFVDALPEEIKRQVQPQKNHQQIR